MSEGARDPTNRWVLDWRHATRAGASSRVDGARTLAFAASASFTIVFIFMDASAAIFLAATRPPRGSSVGEERGFAANSLGSGYTISGAGTAALGR